ncbi:hypothetical protein GCM10010195_08500 [Kitasatospora griseola]|nr:hypothetical protein GCM10010195_08500 [Kitasatospora griseola]
MKHGKWTYCVDLAPDEGRRRTRRPGGFASRAEAAREMAAVLDGELRGVHENRRTTVASLDPCAPKKAVPASLRGPPFRPVQT